MKFKLLKHFYLVVCHVPHIILKVEDEEAGDLMPDEIKEGRRHLRKWTARSPHPLSHGGRHDEQYMIPHGQGEGVPKLSRRDLTDEYEL